MHCLLHSGPVPIHLEQQHLPGTESVYFDIDNTPGLNVTIAIPPFICSVEPGNQFMLLDPYIFFVPSFVVGSFRYPYPSLCCLIFIDLFLCRLKMTHKVKCPDTPKGTKNLVTEEEATIETRTSAYLKQK